VINTTLFPGQQLRREVSQIFGLSPGPLTEGSMRIDSSATGLVGDVSYTDPSGAAAFRASLPLESEPAKFAAFAHLDNAASSFTRVALFNPNAQAANVEVKVFRADGSPTGTATAQVPAQSSFSQRLAEMVSASAGQVGGYFTLTSDQPVVAGAIFGTTSLSMLAALPAQHPGAAVNTVPVTSVSAASFSRAALAPESIAAAFGTELATTTQGQGATDADPTAPGIQLPTSLAGTTVKVKDGTGTERLAPLFYVRSDQVNYQIPAGTAPGPATVTITNGNGTISTGTVQIEAVSPGLFSANSNGQGVAAGSALRVRGGQVVGEEPIAQLNAQNQWVTRPLDLGPSGDEVYLVLYGTGIRFRRDPPQVSATVGGISAPVFYAREQCCFVGLDQVNLLLPRGLIGKGEVDVVLTVEGKTANPVKVNLK
jgi:uncharacterized protein (TIGR03437 family)